MAGAHGCALVTGASSGIGRELARELAAKSYDLVLVARDSARLENLAAELTSSFGISCEALPADLSTSDGTAVVMARLSDPERPIEVLVNNAGLSVHQDFVGGDLAREEYLLDVLVRAVLRLTHAALPGMVARGSGRIINVSSIAGWTPSGTYSAAKSWVTVFSESLVKELVGTGVTVTALCPGLTLTEFHERAGMQLTGVPTQAWLTPRQVATQGLTDAFAGKAISVPSARYKALTLVARYAPRPLLRRVPTSIRPRVPDRPADQG